MPNGEMPDELEDALVDCVRTSLVGDYNIVSIKPIDKAAYALGDYEQAYQVPLITDSGHESVTLEASKMNDSWEVRLIRSTIGN